MATQGPTRWLTPEEQRHWRAYLRGSRMLVAAMDEALAPYQLRLSDYEILSMLSEAPGGRLRMSALAELVVQSRSRVTHTAARLERLGWVRRSPTPEDRRGVEVALTPEGLEVLREMAAVHVQSVLDSLVDRLTPEQFRALGEAMQQVVDARDHLPEP